MRGERKCLTCRSMWSYSLIIIRGCGVYFLYLTACPNCRAQAVTYLQHLTCERCFTVPRHIKVNISWKICGPNKGRFVAAECEADLTAESVESSALSLQSIDDIHGGDSLSLRMLGVGDCVSDNVLKENLQDSSGFLIDETGDTFHTTSTSQSTNSRLGDTLDVITKNFPVTLGASLS